MESKLWNIFLVVCMFKGAGALLDLTMIIPQAFIDADDEPTIKCITTDNATEISFNRAGNIGNGLTLPEEVELTGIYPEIWPGRQMKLLVGEDEDSRFGMYYCSARDKYNQAAASVGIIMSNRALLLPAKFTYSISIGDEVSMEVVQTHQMPPRAVAWYLMKRGRYPEFQSRGSLTHELPPVKTPMDQGPYLVFYQTRGGPSRLKQQAVMRLTIRACEEGKYGQSCKNTCDKCLNGGACDVRIGECVCPPGFKGKLCEKPCGFNKFGGECQYSCSTEDTPTACRGYQFCLPDPYGCSCGPGFSGITCTYPCDSGMYGAGCQQECHCKSNRCDEFTGVCNEGEYKGCINGWTGINCQEPCLFGTFGPNCKEQCGRCVGSVACDIFTGKCPLPEERESEDLHVVELNEEDGSGDVEPYDVEDDPNAICAYGYLPPTCKEKCQSGTWGNDCVYKCNCKDGAHCNSYTGLCPIPTNGDNRDRCKIGWKGLSCNTTCDKGSYGRHCSETCGKCADNAACDIFTGECKMIKSNQCKEGYVPPYCKEHCEEGYFGINCSELCNCDNKTTCHPETGSCFGFCKPGWTGDDCYDRCPFGTYGMNCSETCGHCLTSTTNTEFKCKPDSGICPYGCLQGWEGSLCDHGTLCDPNPCHNDGVCRQAESIYRCRCLKGFVGSHCTILQPPCLSNPCQNQGLCVENTDRETYVCRCMALYTGINCEVSFEEIDKDDKPVHNRKTPQQSFALLPIVLGAVLVAAFLCAIVFYKCKVQGHRNKILESIAGDFESEISDQILISSKPPRKHKPKTGVVAPLSPAGLHITKAEINTRKNETIRHSLPAMCRSELFTGKLTPDALRYSLDEKRFNDSFNDLKYPTKKFINNNSFDLMSKPEKNIEQFNYRTEPKPLIQNPGSNQAKSLSSKKNLEFPEFIGSPRYPEKMINRPISDGAVGRRRRGRSLNVQAIPRDVEEEFEMETRRGSVRNRPWASTANAVPSIPKAIPEENNTRRRNSSQCRRNRRVSGGKRSIPFIDEPLPTADNGRNIQDVLKAIETQADLVTRNSKQINRNSKKRRSRINK